jgi:excisionase family DNA binding protein
MSDMDTLLTTKQLQELLQVDRITIYRMLQDGRLQGFKVGGQWRFSRQAIEHWLQEQRAAPSDTQPRGSADSQHPSAATLPISCIRAIQDVFAEALGIGTVTTAVDGTPLTPVAHSCAICTRILGTEAGRQRCVGSWQAAAYGSLPARRAAERELAECKAGARCPVGHLALFLFYWICPTC